MNRLTDLFYRMKYGYYNPKLDLIKTVFFGICILTLVYYNAVTSRELSDFRIEAKPAIDFYKEYKPFIENLRRERESVMNLPVVPGF